MTVRHLVRSEGKRTLERIVLSRFFVFWAFLVVVSYAGAAVFNIKDGAGTLALGTDTLGKVVY
jgi:hypothetical protein